MEIFLEILDSYGVAAAITVIGSIITLLLTNQNKKLKERVTHLENENTQLKIKISEQSTRLREYEYTASAEFNTQLYAQNQQSRENSNYMSWND